MSSNGTPLVEATALVKSFAPRAGLVGARGPVVRAVDHVDLVVRHGETLGLVQAGGARQRKGQPGGRMV